MELEYDYVNISNNVIGLNQKVLMVRVEKETFLDASALSNISDEVNKKYSIVNGEDIVVFAVNDPLQQVSYRGNTACSDWLTQRKCDSDRFKWSSKIPDITKEPRMFKV